MNKKLMAVLSLGLATGLLYALTCKPSLAAPAPLADIPSPCELVVLADPNDRYYPLAEKIAAAEAAPLAATLSEALACQPLYLLWVASPGSLSDTAMLELGQAMRASAYSFAPGVITASTLDAARALWQRGVQVQPGRFFAANAPWPAAHIDEGRLIEIDPAQSVVGPLTQAAFIDALQSAAYLTITGHGGSRYLRLDEDTRISEQEVPALGPLVIASGGCQTFQPWEASSIALQFVDQGAAAYVGFVFSPNEGYLIGEYDELPFRYTWPEFPIGLVIQAQNRGAVQGYTSIPYLQLLGDPRIAFQSEPPYQLVDDQVDGEWRTLTFQQVPAGALPIRVEGGAAYAFVEAEEITSASDQDPFYNSRLQMVNIRQDKYLLLLHPGGDLTLRLRQHTPWLWFLADLLQDSFDYTFVFLVQSQGDLVTLGFAVLPLLWMAWQLLKKRLRWHIARIALGLGAGAAVLHAVYALARLDELTIISKPVVLSLPGVLGTFILTGCGALIFFQSRTWFGKTLALLVTTFPSWSAAVGGFLLLFVYNQLGFVPKLGVPLWNTSLAQMPLVAFCVVLIISGILLGTIDRALSNRRTGKEVT